MFYVTRTSYSYILSSWCYDKVDYTQGDHATSSLQWDGHFTTWTQEVFSRELPMGSPNTQQLSFFL